MAYQQQTQLPMRLVDYFVVVGLDEADCAVANPEVRFKSHAGFRGIT